MDRATPCRTLSDEEFQKLSDFRYQLRCFLRHSEDICRQHGLTALQHQLLLHIRGMAGRDWASVGELAERLQAKHHGTVALVDRCAQAGLVKRRSDSTDRRVMQMCLLEHGVRLVERVAEPHQPELQHLRDEMLAPIPEAGSHGAGDD